MVSLPRRTLEGKRWKSYHLGSICFTAQFPMFDKDDILLKCMGLLGKGKKDDVLFGLLKLFILH